jgi:hypothetical protein
MSPGKPARRVQDFAAAIDDGPRKSALNPAVIWHGCVGMCQRHNPGELVGSCAGLHPAPLGALALFAGRVALGFPLA